MRVDGAAKAVLQGRAFNEREREYCFCNSELGDLFRLAVLVATRHLLTGIRRRGPPVIIFRFV